MPPPAAGQRYGLLLRGVGDVLTKPTMEYRDGPAVCRCLVRVYTGGAERPDEDVELVAGGQKALQLNAFRVGDRICFRGSTRLLTRENGSLGLHVGLIQIDREEDQMTGESP